MVYLITLHNTTIRFILARYVLHNTFLYDTFYARLIVVVVRIAIVFVFVFVVRFLHCCPIIFADNSI